MSQGSFQRAAAWLLAVLSLALFWPSGLRAEEPYQIERIRQIGTSTTDMGQGIAADAAGNAYITGYSSGSLAGPNLGFNDAFLLKYDPAGNQVWSRRLATDRAESGTAVSLDGQGGVYVAGGTNGDLGGPRQGATDVFVAKYDLDGTGVWTRQFGTNGDEIAYGVATHGPDNIFFAGTVVGHAPIFGQEAQFGKYDAGGNLEWTRELSIDPFERGTEARSAAADGLGNLYIAGFTEAPPVDPELIIGDRNVFLAKYNGEGNQEWARHIESDEREWAEGIAVDALGNAYITGSSDGSLLVSKYDANGDHIWTDTSNPGWGHGVEVDALGNAYVTGQTSFGVSDVFVAKYDPGGALLWTREFGSSSIDHGLAIALDGVGKLFVTGRTFGSLAAPNTDDWDVFVARLSPVPEPTSVALFLLGCVGLMFAQRRAFKKSRIVADVA